MIIDRCWKCMEQLGGMDICPHCGLDPDRHGISASVLMPNTILHGKYLVGNVLGQGGFGITYIAFDLTLEMKVAIKEYFPVAQAARNNQISAAVSWRQTGPAGESWRDGCTKFLAEARKMAKINAVPEIVSVRDTFEENNTAYIVMDYVPGVNLKDYMRSGGFFTYQQCVELLMPLIEGLDKVHRQGIIHRDISPDNLMITPEGKVYLLDLGAAKDMEDARNESGAASKRGFSPIEQNSHNGRIGPWTDVYALAASIYYCIYGKLVPSSVERLQEDTLSFQHKTKEPLTEKQINVLKKGLAVRQEFRYQTAMDFYIALKESVSEKKGKSKRQTRKLLACAAALVLAAGGLLLMVTKPWLPTVKFVGLSDSTVQTKLAIKDREYEYFTDLDDGLVCVKYNEEEQTFYVDSGEVIYPQDPDIPGDGVDGITLTDENLYFTYYGGEGKTDYLIRADFDGQNQTEILALDCSHTNPQYVELSNGSEFFYYLIDEDEGQDQDEEGFDADLVRYNPRKERTELVAEDVYWYALKDRYVYYITWDPEIEKSILYRATLAGKNVKKLDDTHNYAMGFVEGDQLYLLQYISTAGDYNPGLVPVDENGQAIEEGKGIFSLNWGEMNWAVGGGWIFYNPNDTDELYRIRLDGTEKTLIYSGYRYDGLTYCNSNLYFRDGAYNEDRFDAYQAFLASYDGAWIVNCGFSQEILTNDQGVQYVIENGQAKLIGYVGTETDVILPLEIDGYPLNDSVVWKEFYLENVNLEDIAFYALIPESDLTYTTSAEGVTITGYSGQASGSFGNVAVPSAIGGQKVVEIAKGVFADCTFQGVYLPDQLSKIAANAFDNCTKLNNVVFPDTLTEIDDFAFRNCSFEGRSILLPDSIVSLGSRVFMNANPKRIHIPKSLGWVGDGFLAGCGGVYDLDADHPHLSLVDGVLMTKGGSVLMAFPRDVEGHYAMPTTVRGIESYAFYDCAISSIHLPYALSAIEDYAFSRARNLTSVTIPSQVSYLGEGAFQNSSLQSVIMKRSITVGENAFDANVSITYRR